MGLAEFQKILAHLFVDPSLRSRVLQNEPNLATEWNLTDAEWNQLRSIASRDLELFADTLRSKRLDDASKILRLTAQRLGPHPFRTLCLPLLTPGLPPRRHHDDARTIANQLRQLAAQNQLNPPWLADLAHYEASYNESRRLPFGLLVRRFHHPIRQTIQLALQPQPNPNHNPSSNPNPNPNPNPSPTLQPRPTLAIWLRLASHRWLFHRILF